MGLRYPKRNLAIAFTVWKVSLLCLVLLSPGPGYDTSTGLSAVLSLKPPATASTYTSESLPASVLETLGGKLVRWDAIYFTQIARRGYTFEQEWAFGWGWTSLLHYVTQISGLRFHLKPIIAEAVVGIVVAHISHFLSVLVLYELTRTIFDVDVGGGHSFAFLAACLHIISPAGVFLSAPYAESSFALLNFLGFHLYAKSRQVIGRKGEVLASTCLVASGVCFGLATTLRGNGLLSGLLFITDAFEHAIAMRGMQDLAVNLGRTIVALMAGVIMGIIAILPQYIAYVEFCSSTNSRPWCLKLVPSIYAWVQKTYWNTGFLRYWTITNLPLFLLAIPILSILTYSGLWLCHHNVDVPRRCSANRKLTAGQDCNSLTSRSEVALRTTKDPIWRFAIPQLVLAIMTFTIYHVQIITRLSSGYPVWYWWLASLIESDAVWVAYSITCRPGRWIVRWMIIYAVIQAGLFAGFLPPA